MPRRKFTYIKLDDHLAENERLEGYSLGVSLLAEATFARALSYCHRNQTDGRITAKKWARIGNARGRRVLVECGLVRAEPGCYVVPHYLEVYPTRQRAEEISERRAKAARTRWDGVQSAEQSAEQLAMQSAPPGAVQPAYNGRYNMQGKVEERSHLQVGSLPTGGSAGAPPRGKRGTAQAPNATEICTRCGRTGHSPTNCPTGSNRPGDQTAGLAAARAALAEHGLTPPDPEPEDPEIPF
jgi:hypothetical protein